MSTDKIRETEMQLYHLGQELHKLRQQAEPLEVPDYPLQTLEGTTSRRGDLPAQGREDLSPRRHQLRSRRPVLQYVAPAQPGGYRRGGLDPPIQLLAPATEDG